ncbi:MAG: DUF4382 domain-containing protein [Gemmatimonadota bacterium]|nr:DUF4382 domain-containing protein [Gemmatimonadota bacterium]
MEYQIRRAASVAALALAGLAGISCTDAPTATAFGTMNVLLKDAPGDVATAVVTIESVYLQSDTAQGSGRIVLRDTPVTIDLLTLRDTAMSLVSAASIPAGKYHQLRFVISDAYIAVVGTDTTQRTVYATSPAYAGLPAGTTVDGTLQMPSFASSGLKVKLPGDAVQVDANGVTTLLVDFNVAQSFGRVAGASGRWVMSPVVQATAATNP